MTLLATQNAAHPWPVGTGEMAHRIRHHDWCSTGMGPVAQWPAALRSAISLMLPAQAQMVVFWGPQFITFYNDAYAPTIGNKHPAALGALAAHAWQELWDDLEPLLQGVWTTGETFSATDRHFRIERHGYLESVYFDVSFSALRDDAGSMGGVLCIVSETTARVLAAQSLQASQARLLVEQAFTKLLLDASTEGIYAIDQHGMTTLCNAAFVQLLGFESAEQVLGRSAHELIHHRRADGSHFPEADCPILQCARLGKAATVMADVFFKANGDSLPVDYRAEPVWRAGRLEGAICIFSDASERVAGQLLRQGKRAAELALHESHEQLRLAEVASGVGLFLLDVHDDTITASAEFFRMFGLAPADRIAARTIEALGFDGEAAPSSFQERVRGVASLDAEYRIRRADTGEVRWISRRGEFVHDANGVVKFMRGVVQDVTDRRLTQANADVSQARFSALLQAIPNQVWMADSLGGLSWLNQVACDYAGLPADAMKGELWAQLIHPSDIERVSGLWAASLQTLAPYVAEMRIRRHDGVYRWHLSRALPLQFEGGVQWLGANTDIDDQKATQVGLAARNVRLGLEVDERTRDLDRMWRLSTDLILIAGTDGRVKSINPAWEKLLGWSLADVQGRSLLQLVHPDDLLLTQTELESLARGQTTRRFENRYRRKDGTFCTISWVAVPDGALIHALGRDISAALEAQNALQQVEERLRQSQKMEALGQLTGGIAHDFNNLLQGISGSIEIVRGRLAEGRFDDVERFMDSATQSAHRAASLIHRLLAFARRQSLNSRPVDVNKLVLSMEDLLRRTLGEQIELQVATGALVWTARSDENQLESAILNLAINARDAMAHGGCLTIETLNATLDAHYVREHEGLLAGDYAVVSVTDTGSGMTPAVLAKVFEPFFTTKPIGQGTGLGLSGIYGFAKQSGGHVRIHSQPGQGTTVRLYLPRHGEALLQESAAPAADVPPGDGQTVLVVEDDPAVRMVVLDELTELGYVTLEAADGPSALPFLQSDRAIDLLLTDVGLPGMNGRQVAEIARQHRPRLRVLFMTGYAEQASSRASFLAPGMEIITKPFTMDDLAARISSIFRGPGDENSGEHTA